MSTRTLLRGGRVVDPVGGTDEVADVLVDDGTIIEVGDGLDDTGAEVVDVAGLVVTAGFVDLHTHLREPGFEEAEDVATGSAAGAAGGYTALCAMANTDPVCDSAAVAEMVWRRGREVGLVDVFPVGAITKGLAGRELAELGELHGSQARVDCFSDDGMPVADALIMRRALQYATRFDAVIMNHSEEPTLTHEAQMNEGRMSSVLGLAGWPHEAEEVMIARDLILAAGVGARLHVPHVTTRQAAELIRQAKARGVRVTAEVTPHHLSIDDAVVATYDSRFKVNPPVRTTDDVAALRAALADGTIDAVATDHAPHAAFEKDVTFEEAPRGIIGLETAASVVHAAVGLDQAAFFERMAVAPAAVVGETSGPLALGSVGMTVFDPECEWIYERPRSKSANSPWLGARMRGRVRAVLTRSEIFSNHDEVTL